MQPTAPDLNVTVIRAVLADQHGGLTHASIVPIAEGGDFQTVRVDEALIFRFPRDEPMAAWPRREIAVPRHYTEPADPHLFECHGFYARRGALEQFALLFTGASDTLLDLLLTQLRYAFT